MQDALEISPRTVQRTRDYLLAGIGEMVKERPRLFKSSHHSELKPLIDALRISNEGGRAFWDRRPNLPQISTPQVVAPLRAMKGPALNTFSARIAPRLRQAPVTLQAEFREVMRRARDELGVATPLNLQDKNAHVDGARARRR